METVYFQGLYTGKGNVGGTSEPIVMEEDEPYILRSKVVPAMKKMQTGKAGQVAMKFHLN